MLMWFGRCGLEEGRWSQRTWTLISGISGCRQVARPSCGWTRMSSPQAASPRAIPPRPRRPVTPLEELDRLASKGFPLLARESHRP
jgi:hypothetical protein